MSDETNTGIDYLDPVTLNNEIERAFSTLRDARIAAATASGDYEVHRAHLLATHAEHIATANNEREARALKDSALGDERLLEYQREMNDTAATLATAEAHASQMRQHVRVYVASMRGDERIDEPGLSDD